MFVPGEPLTVLAPYSSQGATRPEDSLPGLAIHIHFTLPEGQLKSICVLMFSRIARDENGASDPGADVRYGDYLR